jgi:pimeloyl-ACP methyl ester carboxylesterase
MGGGHRVHLYCTGNGSPTVMVVGGGFSFDWGMIQPEVARFTRICTYDPSGTAWSDLDRQKPVPRCADRVDEIHRLLVIANVPSPYILVGFSIGGLIGRLYTQQYPDQVAGIVIIDHAFINIGSTTPPPQPPVSSDSPPVLISAPPISFGIEDDQNFSKLPQRNRDLHAWAVSNHPLRPAAETAAECSAAIELATKGQPYPFRDRPVIVIRTIEDQPAYESLQASLLRLSRNSKQVVAQHSSHAVIIDEPDLVTTCIRTVFEAAKTKTKLR